MFSNQTSGVNIKTNNFSSITHVILHFGEVIDYIIQESMSPG